MFSTCPYSGLQYLCTLCPEDDAPCYYMKKKREDAKKNASSLKKTHVKNLTAKKE